METPWAVFDEGVIISDDAYFVRHVAIGRAANAQVS